MMNLGVATLTDYDSLISAVRNMMFDAHTRESGSQYRSRINERVAYDLPPANTTEGGAIHGLGCLLPQSLLGALIGTIWPGSLKIIPTLFTVTIISSLIEKVFIVG
jgi:hypothetical protein